MNDIHLLLLYLFFADVKIQVQHPAAKSMIEISRTQDEEVGDGTTSVIILGNVMFIFIYIFIALS